MGSAVIPVYYEWRRLEVVNRDGEIIELKAMVPTDRFHNVAASQFKDGERYQMEVVGTSEDERTGAEHRHFMASVKSAFDNLPGDMAAKYASPTALRKAALIKCGYYHEHSQVFDNPTQAMRAAAFMKPLFDYDVVIVKDNVVKHFRAKSQSYARAGGMNKEEFRKSRDDVLALLADYIGVKKSELKQAGERPPA